MLTLQIPQEFDEILTKRIKGVFYDAMEEAKREAGITREYLSRIEVMELMGVGRSTLNQWNAKGLPLYKIDNKTYLKKSDIYNFVDAHQI